MLAHYLGLAASYRPPAPGPMLSALALSPNPGYCNVDAVGQHATIELDFSVANNSPAYEVHVLESGVLQATVASSAVLWTYTTPGEVENGGRGLQPYTFNFTVQLVRIADGVVLQESSASYSSMYGTCR